MVGASGSAQAQSYDWTGIYFGGYAGRAWGQSQIVTTSDCDQTFGFFSYYCSGGGGLANAARVDAAGTGIVSDKTPIYGMQVGVNLELRPFVIGLEADYGTFNLSGFLTGSDNYTDTFGIVSSADIFTLTHAFDTDWLATLRGRAGISTDRLFGAHDRLFIYATGGRAMTDIDYTFTFSDTLGAVGSAYLKRRLYGWVWGGGLEYKLTDRWSVKAEYLRLEFGSFCTSAIIVTGPYSQGIGTCADLSADMARVGINFKL
jgi:outer membrane immunogenic protein